MAKAGKKRRIDPVYAEIMVKGVIKLSAFLVLMFIAAGRINYWQGWVFSGLVFIYILAAAVLLSHTPGLAKERVCPGPGIKRWDNVLLVVFGVLSMATFIISPLDAGRFGWTRSFPAAVYILSNAVGLWAMWENRFFSSVVRIQNDRGHVVVVSGPYRLVRHPGYVGGALMLITSPLILGSVAGMIPGCLSVVFLVIRTCLEDRTLQEELPGYQDYARKVKYRLIPGIW